MPDHTTDEQTPEYHEARAIHLLRVHSTRDGDPLGVARAQAHATLALALRTAEAATEVVTDLGVSTEVASHAPLEPRRPRRPRSSSDAEPSDALGIPASCQRCGAATISLSYSIVPDVNRMDPNQVCGQVLVHAGCDSCSASLRAWPLGEFLAKAAL